MDLADIGIERIPGTLGINFLVSTLLDLETQATATSPTIDWKGTLGPDPGNLFDEPPVITGGRNALDPNPTSGQGTTEAGYYDILGRRFFVGIEARF